jgi:pimeloyl-ACP methyl ester carboxylesterase
MDYTTDLSSEMRLGLVILVLFNLAQGGYCQDGFVEGQPKLAYWKIGHKSQIVIVLHGGPDATHDYLRPEFDGLSQVATVIYYDQRGIGKSESATGYSWPLQVADLDRVIRRFSTGKVFLAASSWGTTLAVLYAYRHPGKIEGLLLSGTYLWEGLGMDSVRYHAYIHQMDSSNRAHYPVPAQEPVVKEIRYKIYEQRQITNLEEIKRRGYSTLTVEKEVIRVGRANTAELRYSLVTAPVLDSLSKIAAPVLLFNGSWKNCSIDWAHRYVKIFPHAELYTIPAACHDPWLSDPKKFCAKSIEFIRRVVKNQP